MVGGIRLMFKVNCCEERKAPLFQADPRLRPAGAMVVEPNTKLLRLQLLVRGHKWQVTSMAPKDWSTLSPSSRGIWFTFKITGCSSSYGFWLTCRLFTHLFKVLPICFTFLFIISKLERVLIN